MVASFDRDFTVQRSIILANFEINRVFYRIRGKLSPSLPRLKQEDFAERA
jgi:hypothetical protein